MTDDTTKPASPHDWQEDAMGLLRCSYCSRYWSGAVVQHCTVRAGYEVRKLRARVAELERELARVRELVRMHKLECWGLDGLSDRPGEVLNESDRMLYEAVARGVDK